MSFINTSREGAPRDSSTPENYRSRSRGRRNNRERGLNVENLREKEKLLHEYLSRRAGELKEEGVPIDTSNFRIDMKSFAQYATQEDIRRHYSPEQRRSHSELVRSMEERKALKNNNNQEHTLQYSNGENFEVLVTAILDKFLKDKFIVVRSASYDDYRNSSDTVIVDKATGNVVCALDQVAESGGSQRYLDKKDKIRDINLKKTGGELTYGLTIDPDNGSITIKPMKNLPVFYISISKEPLMKALVEFLPDPDNKSAYEKKLFVYFCNEMLAQISQLELEPDLDKDLSDKLTAYGDEIRKLSFVN